MHAEETKSCAVAWEFHVAVQYMLLEKTKRTIIKGSKFNLKSILCGLKEENFNAIDENFLEFVQEKHTDFIPFIADAIWMKAVEVATFLKMQ